MDFRGPKQVSFTASGWGLGFVLPLVNNSGATATSDRSQSVAFKACRFGITFIHVEVTRAWLMCKPITTARVGSTRVLDSFSDPELRNIT